MNSVLARLLVIGGSGETLAALARHCPRTEMVSVANEAAALDYLHGRGSGQVPARPKLIVLETATGTAAAAAAAISVLKSDLRAELVPLVVLHDGGGDDLLDVCYRAGANACMEKPAALPALTEAAAVLLGFWLSANELPAAAG